MELQLHARYRDWTDVADRDWIVQDLPKKVEDIKYAPSISEIDITTAKAAILVIMKTYLETNIKGKSLMEPNQIEMVLEFFLQDCKNLQIEEINIIFKNGVLGRYGAIYNDISIDTICGLNGWVESYYKNDRKNIKEPQIKEPIYNGKEMTFTQFLDKNPDIKRLVRIADVKKIIGTKHARITDVQELCELYGHIWEEKKVKLYQEYENFEHKEMLNFDQWCIVFIKSKIK